MFVFTAVLFATLRLFGQASTNPPPALSPAYPEIPPSFWEQHGTMIIAGGITLIALAVLILWRWFQPKPVVVLPPEMVARAALAKLLCQAENGTHLSEVLQILRRYVITALELPPGEFTTGEFAAVLAGSQKIGPELAETISSFLREGDARKFAPPGVVGVQASACLDGPPATPDTLKREFQPAAARALEIVTLVETATHRQDARATPK